MCTVANNIVNTDSSLWTPLLSEDARGQAYVQYSGRCCICGSTGHSSDGALPRPKLVSPFSAPNSKRTILTNSCLNIRTTHAPIASARFPRNRQVSWRYTSGSGCFRYSNREHNSTSPGSPESCRISGSYIHRLYKPEPRQQSGLQVQPISTP